jgi:hypothetical protein
MRSTQILISCTDTVMGMNAHPAVEEYSRRFPDRRHPNRAVFSSVLQRLRNTGSFTTSIRESGVRQRVHDQEETLRRVQRCPRASVRRISRQMLTSRMQIWRTLYQESRNHTTASVCKFSNPSFVQLEYISVVGLWNSVVK